MENGLVTARFVGAFLDELARWGVREAVVCPGSRSTPLAMCAYELARREPGRLRVTVDVDERGAAFLALGMAKASGRPAAVVCTSGTAVANFYPAVLEAAASRVPLVVLTGDRPPRLQGLGAPQTCDQLGAYGAHVRAFRQMPLPTCDDSGLALARQAAREAVLAADPLGTAREAGLAGASALAGARALEGAGAGALGGAREGDCADAPTPGNARVASAIDIDGMRLAGACLGGPVHVNFPFEEPFTPVFSDLDPFAFGRRGASAGDCPGGVSEGGVSRETSAPASTVEPVHAPEQASFPALAPASEAVGGTAVRGMVRARAAIDERDAARLAALMGSGRALVLAGEGTCSTISEAREVLSWANAFELPLLADPLSGLRSFDEPCVIDNHDSVASAGGAPPEELMPQVIVRFGRYPVSKRATQLAARATAAGAVQVVVDPFATRDFNAATDVFVPVEPVAFARALMAARGAGGSAAGGRAPAMADRESAQAAFFSAWARANEWARERISAVDEAGTAGPGISPDAAGPGAVGPDTLPFEGAIVRRMLRLAPAGSCVFSASSMSIRALDTFYLREDKPLAVLCNRGLNGIDGTVSSAVGAACSFAQTTLLIGDLALLHDLNALALQRELLGADGARGGVGANAGGATCDDASGAPSLVIVLLNNNGGAIFDMLPQRSDAPYFERLFLTPQDVDFAAAARAFGVPYRRATSVDTFERAYCAALGTPGITLIEVPTALRGLPERYAPYWDIA